MTPTKRIYPLGCTMCFYFLSNTFKTTSSFIRMILFTNSLFLDSNNILIFIDFSTSLMFYRIKKAPVAGCLYFLYCFNNSFLFFTCLSCNSCPFESVCFIGLSPIFTLSSVCIYNFSAIKHHLLS